MKRSKFTEEQITFALRQHDAGNPVAGICRQIGVSEATFFAWKNKYAHMGVSELRELRQLREENTRLTRGLVSHEHGAGPVGIAGTNS